MAAPSFHVGGASTGLNALRPDHREMLDVKRPPGAEILSTPDVARWGHGYDLERGPSNPATPRKISPQMSQEIRWHPSCGVA